MKNRDEYIAEVFSRRDEYKKAQKKRRKKYAVSGTALALCCAIVISIPIYNNRKNPTGGDNEQAPRPSIFKEHSAVLEQKKSVNLMDGVTSNAVEKKKLTNQFIYGQADFSMKLFSEVYKENSKKNVILSPVSIQIALAMTSNGAVGDTLAQMEKTLGNLPVSELNKNFYSYIKDLPNDEKCKVQIADSIWYRDDNGLEVKKDFLQKNGDYYGAAAYKAPFDSGTLNDINRWVKDNTNGKIDRILEEINPTALLYLINAVSFDAKWADPYMEQSVGIGTFTALDGSKRYTVPMMRGAEYSYIDDGKATGFVKDYAGGKYQFVALLPNENVTLDEYIDFLSKQSPQKLISRWKNPQYGLKVLTEMPKFKSDFDTELSEPLKKMGMVNAFDSNKADFSAMGKYADGNIFITKIIHKATIEVNENGTSAAAATIVGMDGASAPLEEKIRYVTLDRPFVYLIVDSQSGLPLFIGTVTDIK